MFVQRFAAGFKVKDRKTMTAGIAISIEAVINDAWVTGKGPMNPSIISSTCPGRNNESMSAYMYNNIMAIHNAESFIFTLIFISSISMILLSVFIFHSF